MKVFIWYYHDPASNESMKIYAVAENLGAAHSQVDKVLPGFKDIMDKVIKTEPMVFNVPFAEVNTFKDGKGAAFTAAGKAGL